MLPNQPVLLYSRHLSSHCSRQGWADRDVAIALMFSTRTTVNSTQNSCFPLEIFRSELFAMARIIHPGNLARFYSYGDISEQNRVLDQDVAAQIIFSDHIPGEFYCHLPSSFSHLVTTSLARV